MPGTIKRYDHGTYTCIIQPEFYHVQQCSALCEGVLELYQRIDPFGPATLNSGLAGLESFTGQSTVRVLTRGMWVAKAPIKLLHTNIALLD